MSFYNRLMNALLLKIIHILSKVKLCKIIIPFLTSYQKKVDLSLMVNKEFIQYVNKKKIGLQKHASEIEMVALRGSNVDYGFYAPIMSGSYNLGLTSSDLYITYQMYKNCLRNLPILKYIIIYFSVFTPGLTLIRTKQKYLQIVYDYFFDIPCQKNVIIDEKVKSVIFKKCSKIKIDKCEENYWGYETKMQFHNFSAKERVRTHLRENLREPNQLIWLKQLAEQIYKDGRYLYIVIQPFRSDYKSELPESKELFTKLYDLQLDNTKIINFYDSLLFDDSDFGDTDHLNEKGAIKLTSEIKKIIYNG